MTRHTVSRTVQVKSGRTYVDTYKSTDYEEVYRNLSSELTAKYINKCTWVKRIIRTPNYNGTDTIVVYYDNDSRSKYIVESR